MNRPVERFHQFESSRPVRRRGGRRGVCVGVAASLTFLAAAGIGAPDPWNILATLAFVGACAAAAFLVRWV